jgi:hypothetical protein
MVPMAIHLPFRHVTMTRGVEDSGLYIAWQWLGGLIACQCGAAWRVADHIGKQMMTMSWVLSTPNAVNRPELLDPEFGLTVCAPWSRLTAQAIREAGRYAAQAFGRRCARLIRG